MTRMLPLAKVALVSLCSLITATGLTVAETSWGNRFYLGGSTQNTTINSELLFTGARFQAQASTSVHEVAFRTGSIAVTGTPKAVVTLRADEGGLPGAILATAVVDITTHNSSVTASFETPGTVVAGQVYHLIIGGEGVDASNFFSLAYNYNGGDYRYTPSTGLPDLSLARVTTTNGGTTWITATQTGGSSGIGLVAARNTETGVTIGQAINVPYTNAVAGAGGVTAQQFLFTPVGLHRLDALTLRLKNNQGGTPITGDLVLSLRDNQQNLLAQGTLATAGSLTSTTFGDYTLTLDTPVELEGGSSYRLEFSSPDSLANSYGIQTLGTIFSNYQQGTFGGTDSYAMVSTNGGTTYTNLFAYDVVFGLDVTAIPEPSALALLAGGVLLIAAVRRSRIH